MRPTAYPPGEEGETDDSGRCDDLRENLDGIDLGARDGWTEPL